MTVDEPNRVVILQARVDKLTEALLFLAGELWAARDRQAVLERLLAEDGVAAAEKVERYHPEGEFADALAEKREVFVARILGYLARRMKLQPTFFQLGCRFSRKAV